MEKPVDELNADDQLSLFLGRVCRADVRLELEILFLYRLLASPGLAIFTPPRDLRGLADACSTMLRKAELPADWEAVGFDALGAAKAAHEERNRLIHDQWMSDAESDDPTSLMQLRADRRSLGFKVTSRTLTDVVEGITSLTRGTIRIQHLHFALTGLLASFSGSGSPAPTEGDRRVVQGDFDLLPDGSYRLNADEVP